MDRTLPQRKKDLVTDQRKSEVCDKFDTMPPPWVILWGAVAFTKTFSFVKGIVVLVVEVIFGGERAACTLCDKIITVVLAGDPEGGIEEIDCNGVSKIFKHY